MPCTCNEKALGDCPCPTLCRAFMVLPDSAGHLQQQQGYGQLTQQQQLSLKHSSNPTRSDFGDSGFDDEWSISASSS